MSPVAKFVNECQANVKVSKTPNSACQDFLLTGICSEISWTLGT